MDAIVSKDRLRITIDLERNGRDGSADADPWLRFETIFEPCAIGGLKNRRRQLYFAKTGVNGLNAADDAVLILVIRGIEGTDRKLCGGAESELDPSTTGSTL